MAYKRNRRLLQSMGQRITARRKARGFTQEQLADEADIGVATVSRLEGGKIDVSVSLLMQVATALGCRVGDLVDPEDARDVEEKVTELWRTLDPVEKQAFLTLLSRRSG